MYATFRKKPTSCLSDKLPTIDSPVCVLSSPQGAKASLSNGHHQLKMDPSGFDGLPSLREQFEMRRRARSVVHAPSPDPVSQDDTDLSQLDSPSATTSWAQRARRPLTIASTLDQQCPADEDPQISSSSSGAGGSPAGLLLRLSLEQRRRHIESTRQRAREASRRAGLNRRHAAFQRLLQQHHQQHQRSPDSLTTTSSIADTTSRTEETDGQTDDTRTDRQTDTRPDRLPDRQTSADSSGPAVASSDDDTVLLTISTADEMERLEPSATEGGVELADDDIFFPVEESQDEVALPSRESYCPATSPVGGTETKRVEHFEEPSTPKAVPTSPRKSMNSIADAADGDDTFPPQVVASEPENTNLSTYHRIHPPFPRKSPGPPKPSRGRRRAAQCPPVTAHNRLQAYSTPRRHSPSPLLDFGDSGEESGSFPHAGGDGGGGSRRPQTSAYSPVMQRRLQTSLTSQSMIAMPHGRLRKGTSATAYQTGAPGGGSGRHARPPACVGGSVDWGGEQWMRRTASVRNPRRSGGPGWLAIGRNEDNEGEEEGVDYYSGEESPYYLSDEEAPGSEYEYHPDYHQSLPRGYRHENWDNASEYSHPYIGVGHSRHGMRPMRSSHSRSVRHTFLDGYHQQQPRRQRRPLSPATSVASTNAGSSLMDPSALAQINRNLSDLQLGLERLSRQQQQLLLSGHPGGELADSRAPAAVGRPAGSSPGQQVVAPRATWDLDGSTGNLSVSAGRSGKSGGGPAAAASETLPIQLELTRQSVDEETAVTSTSSPVSRSLTTSADKPVPVPAEEAQVAIAAPRQSSTGSRAAAEPAPNKLFFIGFEEPDPLRTQRKCDQLEARRAAEKALAAQQLQLHREEEHRQRMEERRRLAENQEAAQQPTVAAGEEFPDKSSKRLRPPPATSNPYPVRSGATALLSRSNVDLSQSPTPPPPASSCALPSKSGSATGDRLSKVRRSTPHSVGTGNRRQVQSPSRNRSFRGTKNNTSSSTIAGRMMTPRSSGDGQAGESVPDDDLAERRRQTKAADLAQQPGNRRAGSQLPSGLSLSSLHRLEAAAATNSPVGTSHGNNNPSSTSTNQPRLFVKPKAKSNRMVIVNAIGHCCLAGSVNEPVKQAALKELAATEGTHFMILFRDARLQYRAVYFFDLDLEELRIICGTGPRRITHDMANRFYKYNSGGKHFSEITSTSHLSPAVDAITIHDTLWSRPSGQSAAINLLSSSRIF